MAMSEDRMHERLGTYGQRWREQQPVPGPVPGGLGERHRTSPRRWVALAAAAAVAVIAGVTWAAHLSMDQTPATPGRPDPDPVAVVPAGLRVTLAQRVTVDLTDIGDRRARVPGLPAVRLHRAPWTGRRDREHPHPPAQHQ